MSTLRFSPSFPSFSPFALLHRAGLLALGLLLAVNTATGQTNDPSGAAGSTTLAKLVVLASPLGGGTVTGGGAFAAGSTQTIVATPAAGFAFDAWSDGNTRATRQVTVPTGGLLLIANFVAATHTLAVSVDPSTGGSVVRSPDKSSYNHLDTVTLTAQPETGWMFVGWTELVPNTLAPVILNPTNPLTLAMTRNFTLTAHFARGTPQPEIDVEGRGRSIASGDKTPSALDDTEFGAAAVVGTATPGSTSVAGTPATEPVVVNDSVALIGAAELGAAGAVSRTQVRHTFLIRNAGTASLNLTGTPAVAKSGPNAADFLITQPAATTIEPGRSVPFVVTFVPTATGIREATLAIANNDGDENPYTFAIRGTGGPAVVPYVPTAAQTSIAVVAAAAEFRATVAIQFNTGGYSVEWGQAVPTGNTIVVNARVFQPTGVTTQALVTLSHAYPLGPLAAGSYQLVFRVSEQTVKTAAFAVYTLATSVAPVGVGRIIRQPAPVGADAYLAGTAVTLAALPLWSSPGPIASASEAVTSASMAIITDPALALPGLLSGYTFQNWSGDASGSVNPLVVKMDANKSVTANFAAPSAEPKIVVAPRDHAARLGGATQLAVAATGAAPLSYQWAKDGVNLAGSTRVVGVTTPTLTIADVQWTDAGAYTVTVTNTAGAVTSGTAALAVLDARHALAGAVAAEGGAVTIRNTLTYAGTPTALGWQTVLPDGWSYAAGAGAEGDVKPEVGTTDLLEWAWTSVPASPISFSYTLNVPANVTGNKAVRALSIFRQPAGASSILVLPDPLPIPNAAGYHSTDTNADFRISLVELTRAIELYNTRNGTTRTGLYANADSETEDGFAPEPNRTVGVAAALSRFYTADSNHDGRVSLLELTRVIELYNFRSGTTRTGQYHEMSGTEDGFAPGP